MRVTESTVEAAALEWLEGLGWEVGHGPGIAPYASGAERSDYRETVLEQRLRNALDQLNPNLPPGALDEAFRKLIRPDGSTLEARNRAFHRLLMDGVTVEYRTAGGAVRGAQISVLDYENPANNDWLAVNQFTVVEGEHERRPDIVLFVNGLPLGLIELKNPADEKATVWTAWNQIQTYKSELTDLFAFNAVLVASDGIDARMGTLTAGREWFKPWRTITGETLASPHLPQLQVMLEGMCQHGRFLTLVRGFIVFDDDGSGKLAKKMAGYHQFHAVETAVLETLRAVALRQKARWVAEPDGRYETGRQPGGDPGDRRIGVVWHTQGSGKSLTMAFYAGRIAREPMMENPTIVVLTDRNDLDDQTLRHVLPLPGPPAADSGPSPEPGRPAGQAGRRAGGRGVHHDPEVPSGREGRPASEVVAAPQHRGDRRRGAPEPVRLHRRLRPPHARRAPQRLVHRLHRHAHRA